MRNPHLLSLLPAAAKRRRIAMKCYIILITAALLAICFIPISRANVFDSSGSKITGIIRFSREVFKEGATKCSSDHVLIGKQCVTCEMCEEMTGSRCPQCPNKNQ
ncbi:hypothetical protein HW555_000911 [Spodoptera exigua]|uniref:Uncharacterized protein n=1 Tax=Spodoptera exigua TaxID=7107 RepID=A0A835GV77_SPOEX|nr:hypothetical protein HW555_000911 [Spodoptera exigua]